jgi:O-antigen ligase
MTRWNAAVALPGLIIVPLALADGGYRPPAWGIAALAILAVCGVALLGEREIRLWKHELVAVGALGALTLLSAVSALWSADPARSLLLAQRTLVYPLALAAALLVVGRRSVAWLLLGVGGACVAVSVLALGAELLPGVFGGVEESVAKGQMAWPIGYWNGLGMLMALGIVINLGIAFMILHKTLRTVLLAAAVPEIIVLVLTQSRGAAVAAVVGVAVVVVLARGVPTRAHGAAVGAVVLVAVMGAVLFTGSDGSRLSSTGRASLWRVALTEFGDHPLAGGGAGSWPSYWYRDRTNDNAIGNPNSLYAETAAELGLAGLALLVVALGAPLAAAYRKRTVTPAAVGGGAFAAFCLHLAVDWDWQLPAVSLAGLLCGAVALIAAREPAEKSWPVPRQGALAACAGLMALVVLLFAGNREVSGAATAVHDADRAALLMPWSPVPDTWLGEARLAQGDRAAAEGAFRDALAAPRGSRQWRLWFNLSRAVGGEARLQALSKALALNPRSGELKALCKRPHDPGIRPFCRERRTARRVQ